MLAVALVVTLLSAQPVPGVSAPPGENDRAALPEEKPAGTGPSTRESKPAQALPAAEEAKPAEASPSAAKPASTDDRPTPSAEDLLVRIQALEAREAERTPKPVARSTAGAFIQNRFNPDISLIADFGLAGTNVSDQTAGSLALPGFLEASGREGKDRGFNFNYLESALSAAVDPYFDFMGIVTLTPEGFDVEEAYVDTRQLPFGFRLRIGKLLSSFGRLNGLHPHAWDFYDTPLVYEAFIGLEGFKNPGIRLSWTAPVDFLLQLDLEVFQGRSDESVLFNAKGYELTAQNGTVLSSSQPFVPSMAVGSVRTSFDHESHVFLLGASVMYGHALQTYTDSVFNASGAFLYNGEFTYKYIISSYRSITWQSEYIGLVSSGDLARASDGLVHPADRRQGGLYSQLIWRFDEPGRWRAGARFDLIGQNSWTVDGEKQTVDVAKQPLGDTLQRQSAMLEYSPTEFSRLRLQYAYDRSRFLDGARKNVHEILLQMNIAVGPHGAHAF
jgi:hypothetical protein